jgi:hypothetical protein
MDDRSSSDEMAALLREIRDNQRRQIEMQTQALGLQREQYGLFKEQYEKASRLQDRAEDLQEKSRALVEKGRKAFMVIVPLLIAAIAYLTWLMVR